jgi:hypothetical protein
MVFIFILTFIAVLFALRGYRRASLYCILLTLITAVLFFYHSITEHLNIQL